MSGGVTFFGPSTLLSAGSMTGTTQIASAAIDMLRMCYASFEAVWTGTPVGLLSVDVSMDNVTFYPTGTQINNQPNGSASGEFINIGPGEFGGRYLRLSYTNSSGSGSLTIKGTAKAAG
jgi:hypothetical protein